MKREKLEADSPPVISVRQDDEFSRRRFSPEARQALEDLRQAIARAEAEGIDEETLSQLFDRHRPL